MENKLQDIFVPYELARILKDDLEFDNSGIAYYLLDNLMFPNKVEYLESQKKCAYVTGGIIAPTWEQAFKFFRDKYKFYSNILGDGFNSELKGFYYSITEDGWINYYESIDDGKWYDTYEEARLECLKQLIKIVKDGK